MQQLNVQECSRAGGWQVQGRQKDEESMKVGAGWGLGCVNTPADLGTMWFDKFNINVWEGLCQSMCVCVCVFEGR